MAHDVQKFGAPAKLVLPVMDSALDHSMLTCFIFGASEKLYLSSTEGKQNAPNCFHLHENLLHSLMPVKLALLPGIVMGLQIETVAQRPH